MCSRPMRSTPEGIPERARKSANWWPLARYTLMVAGDLLAARRARAHESSRSPTVVAPTLVAVVAAVIGLALLAAGAGASGGASDRLPRTPTYHLSSVGVLCPLDGLDARRG